MEIYVSLARGLEDSCWFSASVQQPLQRTTRENIRCGTGYDDVVGQFEASIDGFEANDLGSAV